MFVQYLNADQQAALYHFSKKLIEIDNDVDYREVNLLEVIVSQCEEFVDFNASFDLTQLRALFSDQSQKMAFLIELVGVGLADQILNADESKFLEHIAETLNVQLSQLEEIKHWVQRQMMLIAESQRFLEN